MQKNKQSTVSLYKTSLTLMELLTIFEKESERICRLPVDSRLVAISALLDFLKQNGNSVRIVHSVRKNIFSCTKR
ncbi:MAG: hypothetical protein SCARUB_00765 [Candidatus Scalindua rubra]|uniref:Uncharacterized protein n=1 Tax=Candidatus Scalindua rubra TaxID=1872076 RepID=A0A1E3XEN4_9BACT|nr:MAG: hypothetical protein SCARUB_00765 [Candidatus Scalindua rubra]